VGVFFGFSFVGGFFGFLWGGVFFFFLFWGLFFFFFLGFFCFFFFFFFFLAKVSYLLFFPLFSEETNAFSSLARWSKAGMVRRPARVMPPLSSFKCFFSSLAVVNPLYGPKVLSQ